MGDGFAWTIPLIQMGFGVLFLAAHRAGGAREARAWGIGFCLTAGAFAVPALEPVVPIEGIAVAADVLFAVSFFHYADAIRLRYGGPPLRRARIVLLALSIAAPVSGVLVLQSLQAELLASDVTCAGQLALALVLVPAWPRAWIDRAMIAVSWVTVLDNLMRTASIPLTAFGATFSSFLATDYGYLMQASAMLTGFTFALLALVAVTTDMLVRYRLDAETDPLTGLLNRRGLEAEAATPSANGRVSVVSCDLDHFKRVNDTWGHEAGDRVLVAFARLIRAVLPPQGVAARVGGEEFVLYLPNQTADGARSVAAALRSAMAAHDWTPTGIEGRQAASFGLATGLRPAETLQDLVQRADANLYEAKRCGRDQIKGALAA
ncbi:GGDEF domain-containing protein [Aureimonas pseudogalii]|uniref:diguanylate cyclase n=1 Tax=Aureimonas pseudogalii TaxID=1744844 RepID=A0A7W6H4J3_9HYPH|nr:GGDEF domain-containing protein [Aureimonas pseudogalii]MBB3997144.1 diguanylate cyclase (GGDEF)-like protein [Aureimonas pseudogalii]